jgi:PAS domain S-box-containing protein
MNVLIVDDQPINQKLLHATLEAEGHTVTEATNGVEALQLLESQHTDAVISDILMPGMDGYRLCSEVRKRKEFEHLPFIHYTATYTSSSDEKLSSDLGADVFLRKPASAGEIIGALHRVTGKGHKVRATAASPESDVMKEYSERLVAKLEHKNLELARTLQELESERSQLEHVLEHSPAVIYALKVEGQSVVPYLVSENVTKLLGFTVSESLHCDWWLGQLHPEDRDRVVASISETLTQGTSLTEYRLRHKDGSDRWVEDKRRLIRDSSGEPQEIVGVWTDITEGKRAEEVVREISLQESGRRETTIRRDVFGLLGLTALTFAVEYYFNLFQQAFIAFSDQEKYPLAHEAFGALIFFSLALMVFSYRRWKESAGEIVSQQHIARALRVLHDELDKRVQQRTAELAKANEHLLAEIAQRARAGEVLRESEHRFREMLETLGLIAMTLDKKGKVTFCNEYLLQTTGWKREEIIGEDWFSRFSPDTNVALKKLFFDNIEIGKIPLRQEYPIRTRTGERREIVWNNTMVRDIAGNIVGTASLAEDVTERKQAEERLREQAELLDLAQDAIMVRDMEDRIEFWNHGAEKLYGWTAAEVQGKKASSFLYGGDPIATEAARAAVIENGKWAGECTHTCKDGCPVTVCTRWTLVRDELAAPKSILIINTDVTEQKRLETHLLRAQRLESIGTLASGVAHDLNNILTPILMCAEVLKGSPSQEDLPGLVSMIEESARRGANVVKQVFTFARGVEGERVVIKPSHLIQEMIDIAQQTFPKSIEMRSRYLEDLWSISCDPTQLHQVLLNLSVNARDAMPNGGSLTIGAENFMIDEHYASMTPSAKPGPHVMFRVIDTGAGMSRATIDKIFDPFFTTKEVGKGTGLGLSTVLGIVKSHGGFISVYSEIGNGTTFKIFLPATVAEDTSRKSEVSPKMLNGNGELVLVVDDEPGILRMTKMILEKHNYRVLDANDATEALALIAQQKDPIKVVVTDISMPYVDGVALVRVIKKMRPEMSFIASTGQRDEARVSELQALGVSNFLGKPYDTQSLLKKVHDALSGARSNSVQ